jgi:hypothetical protein
MAPVAVFFVAHNIMPDMGKMLAYLVHTPGKWLYFYQRIPGGGIPVYIHRQLNSG